MKPKSEKKPPRIFLFDVDGTLIRGGGAGNAALNLAFDEVFGIKNAMNGVTCDGKTDPAIVREVLSRRRLDSLSNVSRLLLAYTRLLPRAVAAADGYEVIPGVAETLEYLRKQKGILCGLATGNVERGARVKLDRVKLNAYFPVGGYGSDSESRTDLVRVALWRAREQLKDSRAEAVVIGDTPKDVLAAREVGLFALGVATGRYSVAQLKESGADLALQTLAHPEAWVSEILA